MQLKIFSQSNIKWFWYILEFLLFSEGECSSNDLVENKDKDLYSNHTDVI